MDLSQPNRTADILLILIPYTQEYCSVSFRTRISYFIFFFNIWIWLKVEQFLLNTFTLISWISDQSIINTDDYGICCRTSLRTCPSGCSRQQGLKSLQDGAPNPLQLFQVIFPKSAVIEWPSLCESAGRGEKEPCSVGSAAVLLVQDHLVPVKSSQVVMAVSLSIPGWRRFLRTGLHINYPSFGKKFIFLVRTWLNMHTYDFQSMNLRTWRQSSFIN